MSVQNLPPSDFVRFRNWFVEFEAARWDAQIETDAKSGKLDALAAEAMTEYRGGKALEL
jgi:hypothetical protein